MRLLLISIFSLFLINTATADPIDDLVARLSKERGFWLNGYYQDLDFPESTPTERLVAEIFDHRRRAGSQEKLSTIIKEREVHIPPGIGSDVYRAVLVRTNLGLKIVVLQYQHQATAGWWHKMLDAPQA